MTLKNLMQPDLSQTSSSVGGRWLLSEDAYAVVNPATAQSAAQAVRGGALQAQTAVDAAALAWPTYRQTAMQLAGLLKSLRRLCRQKPVLGCANPASAVAHKGVHL